MEASDLADQLRDAAEEDEESSGAQRAAERFRTRAAAAIGVLAMLLAIASLGGDNASKEMMNANIQASDTWAFYQAKNIRQTDYRLAADQLSLLLPSLPAEQQAVARQNIARYQATADRYEDEPDPNAPDDPLKGDGKKQLSARATDWEQKREHAQAQDPNFDYSQALFQIAIVLGSVAIVAMSRRVLALSLVLGVVATLLMINGFTLLVDLPIA